MSKTLTKEEKVVIGNSDYTREEMESGIYWGLGDSAEDFLNTILAVEREGYEVRFETNIFRRIFGLGIYKVVGYKTIHQPPIP